MTDKNQEQPQFFVIPTGLLQAIAAYLATKPYQDVAMYLQELQKLRPLKVQREE